MILLAFVLIAFVLHDWFLDRIPGLDVVDIAPFRESYSQSRELASRTIAAGSHVAIETGRAQALPSTAPKEMTSESA